MADLNKLSKSALIEHLSTLRNLYKVVDNKEYVKNQIEDVIKHINKEESDGK